VEKTKLQKSIEQDYFL